MTWTDALSTAGAVALYVLLYVSMIGFLLVFLLFTFGAWALGVAQILGWLAGVIAGAAV